MLPERTPQPLSANQPFGEMLLAGLMADTAGALPGTAPCSHACCVLAAVVHQTPEAQRRALAAALEARGGRLATPKRQPLMCAVMMQLSAAWAAQQGALPPGTQTPAAAPSTAHDARSGSAPRHKAAGCAVPALLCLVLELVSGCAEGLAGLLQDASHVPLLLEVVQQGHGLDAGLVRGLAAAVLASCCVGQAQSSRAAEFADVSEIVANRVGLREFFAALDGLMEADEMQVCSPAPMW